MIHRAADATRGREEVERAAKALVRSIAEVAAYPTGNLQSDTLFQSAGRGRR